MIEQIHRVNWVICPECSYRYYVGPQLLLVDDALAACPKCGLEFDPKKALTSKMDSVAAGERFG